MKRIEKFLQFNLPDIRPYIRAYGHPTGYKTAFQDVVDMDSYIAEAIHPSAEFGNFDYILAVLWGRDRRRVIDCFGFRDTFPWPGNPDVSAWVLENGVYVPPFINNRVITCGDSLLLLGLEERHRRGTASLEEYFRTPPGIIF